eukprot:TRINITY_DN7826_c0_g1_i1.p1 TRINITY_DN7826_c0_g1~~TRINITY_DN7826_c0_g1_i1.p1  ORF type:complete len:179 (-),score=8.69 TRINITY_DN7826_c0_g1_i1:23-559(-)
MKSLPIKERPRDLLFVSIFIIFTIAALLLEPLRAFNLNCSCLCKKNPQNLLWPPQKVREFYQLWARNYDGFLLHPPLWFRVLSFATLFVYVPFYVVGSYAFLYGKEWIRIPSLMYCSAVVYSVFPIIVEDLWGKHFGARSWQGLMGHMICGIFGVMLFLRVVFSPLFGGLERKKQKLH